jgi:NADPH:quinone reductase-like Zn-dependent oxidoreductase
MQAIVYSEFGSPDVLHLAEIDKPVPKPGEVLVKVRAVLANPLDWHFIRGEPPVMRLMGKPRGRTPGVDFAGQVEQVGANVTQFRVGDEVFGSGRDAFAQFACASAENVARKPKALTFEQAAAIPVAGCTALLAVRDHGRLQPGQSVLINGAAGGVGTFAVQIAKALGATVTGVCSARNEELVRLLGADHVIDYTTEDFARNGRQYDLVLHVAGNRSLKDHRRALTPDGTLVLVGAGVGRDWGDSATLDMLGTLAFVIGRGVFSRFLRQHIRMFAGKIRTGDLAFLAGLCEAGQLRPVIDRSYALADTAAAIRHLEAGHVRGKVIVIP